MSKQSDAKKQHGYDPKPMSKCCCNCKHFAVDMGWYDEAKTYPKEINKRCTLGGFVVKKTATCNLFEANP